MSTQPKLFETETIEDRSVAHAYSVLRGDDVANGQKPTSRQIGLLRLVADRRGARRAVSAADLARALNCDDRDIRTDVRELREIFGVRIGSARSGQTGYYLITTKEELFDTFGPFLSQAASELRLVRRMCNPHELAELAGQMKLNPNDLTQPVPATR